ncbi:10293_t:CDS:2 [Gigaspora margarita]|uniref:10293_t:CDS:1 n=1 Tax=Gigaspora margarita TaxID=4874 RepID=A0ABM8W700_GIGMA|nr:10293_t:CDS:2 [Gigaspora margarita]
MEIKFDDPRKIGRIPNGALEKKNIETAIIAAAKKTVLCLQVKKTNRISAKCLPVEVWNSQIRCINHLAETKVNKFPHSREDLEG